MKKLFIAFLSITTLACFGAAFIHSNVVKQAKADETVRVIASDADFVAFKTDLLNEEMNGEKIRLDADINYEITDTLTSEKAFRGEFDGNGHSVTITANTSDKDNIALFRSIGSQGTVLNVTTKGTISGKEHVGSVACFNYGLVEKCVNEATITATGQYVGGLIGVMNGSKVEQNTAHLINCENYGNVSTTYSSSSSLGLGGVVGYSYGNVSIVSCSNYGNVSAGTAPFGTGGVLGVAKSGSSAGGDIYITNSYNGGNINADRYVGGILGHIDANNAKVIHLSGCLNSGNIVCSNSSKGYDGQLIGNGKNASSFTLTSSAILGKLTTGTTSNVGQVVGCPAADTYSGVYVASTNGVSDNVKDLIKLVRHFNCNADTAYKAQVTSALANLSSEEETMLSSVTYWDKTEVGNDLDYISAANYIIGYRPDGLKTRLVFESENIWPFAITILALSLASASAILVIRKKKNN